MPGTPITSLLGTLQPSLRDLLTPGLQFMVISHSRVSLVVEIKYSRHIPASKGQAGALKPSAPWSDGQVRVSTPNQGTDLPFPWSSLPAPAPIPVLQSVSLTDL